MNDTLKWHLGRFLTGRSPVDQNKFCEWCQTDLAEHMKEAPPANLRFVGPVLVRSEKDYHVLALPHRIVVLLGELKDEKFMDKACRDFVKGVRSETPPPGRENDLHGVTLIQNRLASDPVRLREIRDHAGADPYRFVREVVAAYSSDEKPVSAPGPEAGAPQK